MQTIIPVRDKNITVQFVPHAVRITTDKELEDLLRKNVRKATAELVSAIQLKYRNEFDSELKVSARSMSVEIWRHAYADQFARWVRTFSRIRIVNKIAGKIIYHSSLIDIGEKGHDSNRFVWDILAPFLSVIAFFLP